MNDTKPWYLSRSIWASLVTVFSGLALVMGHTVTPELQGVMTDLILSLVTTVSGLVAAYYRIVADKKIG